VDGKCIDPCHTGHFYRHQRDVTLKYSLQTNRYYTSLICYG
jgi:hypothetical protein